MSLSVNAILDIEEKAKKIAVEYREKMTTVVDETNRQIEEAKQQSHQRLERYRDEKDREKSARLTAYKNEALVKEKEELTELEQRVHAKESELVYRIIEEVKKRYGSF